MSDRVRGILERLFAIDVRSLAALRIGLAVVVLVDLATRARDLTAHYTDAGALPRDALRLFVAHPLSVHALTGDRSAEAALFLVHGAFATALLVGFRTRLATAGTWVLLVSLQNRNPFILHSGDVVLRLLLFWSLFVPLGARAAVQREPVDGDRVLSAGTAALLLQVAAVYLFAGLLKSGPDWHADASAVEDALRVGAFRTPIGRVLLGFPALLRPLTHAVLWLEIAGAVGLFAPVATTAVRLVTIVLFALLQLGFGLCLALGGFPWIMTVALLPFLPTAFWDALAPGHAADRERARPRRRVVADAVAGTLAVYVLVWNVGTLGGPLRIPAALRPLGTTLGLDQEWRMFAPVPMRLDGWFVFDGEFADDGAVDPFTGRDVAWTRPLLVSAEYRNTRWRKYLLEQCDDGLAPLRGYLRAWLCRSWNVAHPERPLASVQQYFLVDEILPGIGPGEPERVDLGRSPCPRG